jgi:hypothetical protein
MNTVYGVHILTSEWKHNGDVVRKSGKMRTTAERVLNDERLLCMWQWIKETRNLRLSTLSISRIEIRERQDYLGSRARDSQLRATNQSL